MSREEKPVEISEEPEDRGYGIHFGMRDWFGNHRRIAQLRRGWVPSLGGPAARRASPPLRRFALQGL